ncbi:hypothetical protein NQ318_007103 [Aromia moschata]|uniref:Uncharacterized protein n=1 Tax=Aromia moschata TaxID=1265417 RepID=A0AAV8XV31_9CUCU|nr:hypothetical protein NQ318_007103 [Aromia moschata]
MQAVQELLEDDPDRRVNFMDLLMTCIDQSQLSLEWIVFSDEATLIPKSPKFSEPHWMRELHTQLPQKTNVWAGIIQDRIVGPFFL